MPFGSTCSQRRSRRRRSFERKTRKVRRSRSEMRPTRKYRSIDPQSMNKMEELFPDLSLEKRIHFHKLVQDVIEQERSNKLDTSKETSFTAYVVASDTMVFPYANDSLQTSISTEYTEFFFDFFYEHRSIPFESMAFIIKDMFMTAKEEIYSKREKVYTIIHQIAEENQFEPRNKDFIFAEVWQRLFYEGCFSPPINPFAKIDRKTMYSDSQNLIMRYFAFSVGMYPALKIHYEHIGTEINDSSGHEEKYTFISHNNVASIILLPYFTRKEKVFAQGLAINIDEFHEE